MMIYLVILLKLISFFLTTVAPYRRYIQHSGSELYESAPAKRLTGYKNTLALDSYHTIYDMMYLLIGISKSAI